MDEQPGPSNQPGTNQQRPPRQIPSNEQEPPNPQGPTTRTRSRSRLRTSNRIAPSNQPETDDQGPSNQPGPSSEPGSSTQEALAVRRPRSRPAPLFRKPRGARVEPGPPSQRGPSNQPGFDREHPAVRDLERELNASSRSLSPPSPEVRISLRDVQPNAEAVPEQNAGPGDRPDRGIEANLGQNAQLDAQPSLEEDSGAYSCPDADAGLNIQPDVQPNPEQAARGDAGEEDLGQVARPDAQPNMEEDAGINLDQNMELDAPAPVDRAPIPEGGSREVSGLEANAGADPGQNIRPDTQPDDGGDPDSDPEEPVAGRSPQLPPLDYEAACHNCFIFRLPKESWNTAYIYANQRVYSEDLRDDDSYMWLRFGANTTRYCYLFEDFVVLLDFDFDKIDDKENYMLRIFEVDYPKERIYDVRIFDTGKKLALHITKDEGQHVRIYEVDANY
ncbi:unnamed protein product [Bursaphelenchus okinawaensis]|uniref:Uncharacterized protein n=1 Tax=Bursaphelenchus okinawaensis TaxID=465554 RepID=A0A811LA16_9BILA|nr:unnamed protein product [Bursaphelenchus okinawaensis]CAG9119357.1 unnamed protein product [Bursaphelenchus okinawaensis]